MQQSVRLLQLLAQLIRLQAVFLGKVCPVEFQRMGGLVTRHPADILTQAGITTLGIVVQIPATGKMAEPEDIGQIDVARRIDIGRIEWPMAIGQALASGSQHVFLPTLEDIRHQLRFL